MFFSFRYRKKIVLRKRFYQHKKIHEIFGSEQSAFPGIGKVFQHVFNVFGLKTTRAPLMAKAFDGLWVGWFKPFQTISNNFEQFQTISNFSRSLTSLVKIKKTTAGIYFTAVCCLKLCPEQDSNLHTVTATRPSTWRVYQFHHLGIKLRTFTIW
jgi:hypothetical protein